MKERPIIFTHNIDKILDGTKTQTRRVVTNKTSVIGEGGDWAKLCWDGSAIYTWPELFNYKPIKKQETAPLPFVDDGFWEKDHSAPMYLHVPYNWGEDMTIYRVYCRYDVGDRLWVRRSKGGTFIWKKSLAEIWLEITGIRVERVQEISLYDVIAEGATGSPPPVGIGDGKDLFRRLWDSINARRGDPWASNPWVWVVEFKLIPQ